MVRLWIIFGLLSFSAAVSHAEILTMFSDTGFDIPQVSTVVTYPYPTPSGASFNGKSNDVPIPEGYSAWATASNRNLSYLGWGAGLLPGQTAAQDLSRFDNGEIRFWFYSNIDVQLEVSNPPGDVIKTMLSQNGWSPSMAYQWVPIHIDIAKLLAQGSQQVGHQLTLANIINPFLFTALNIPVSGGVFYIDDIRYVDSKSVPTFDVGLFNRSDNSPAQTIDWGNQSLTTAGGWVTAPQYLKFSVDSDIFPWGVQLYTDNTAADANPKFATSVTSGNPGSNPAGLVEVASPNNTLPIAWSVKADTKTAPTAADPNDANDPNYYQWFYMQDRATPAIPKTNTSAFQNGANSITVRNNIGIQFAQGAPSDFDGPKTTGAAPPPNIIYFESFLGGAVSPNTYKTTTLRIEFYYP